MSEATAAPRGGAGSDDEKLTKSDVFELLRNQRRRFVVHYLKRCDPGPVKLGDLAEQVAAWENDVPLAEVSSTQRKRVYTTLQQSHLPKMADAGILEFDADRGIVTPTDVLSELTIYLEVVPERELPWHEFYLALGAVSSALMVAVWAGVEPLASVPASVWGVLIALVIVVSSAANIYSQRRMGVGESETPQELEFGD